MQAPQQVQAPPAGGVPGGGPFHVGQVVQVQGLVWGLWEGVGGWDVIITDAESYGCSQGGGFTAMLGGWDPRENYHGVESGHWGL